MRIWLDTEFIEDGSTIDLISIGMVREDGSELYLENAECDLSRADAWVKENVISKLESTRGIRAHQASRKAIADIVKIFVREKPELWAYFADYDWVVLCQLYGRMIDLPKGWPMYCLDVKQEMHRKGLSKPDHLVNTREHSAIDDARWTRDLHLWVQEQPERT